MPGLKFNEERAMIAFADKLIADKGITGLTNDQKGRLRRNLVDEMSNRLEEAVIMSLPDDKIIELEKLLDGEVTEEQIDALLDGSGVDFKAVYMRGLKNFRDSYLAGEIDVPIPAAGEPKKKPENSGAREQIATAQNGAMTSNEQNNTQNATSQTGSLENALKQAQAGMAQAAEPAEKAGLEWRSNNGTLKVMSGFDELEKFIGKPVVDRSQAGLGQIEFDAYVAMLSNGQKSVLPLSDENAKKRYDEWQAIVAQGGEIPRGPMSVNIEHFKYAQAGMKAEPVTQMMAAVQQAEAQTTAATVPGVQVASQRMQTAPAAPAVPVAPVVPAVGADTVNGANTTNTTNAITGEGM